MVGEAHLKMFVSSLPVSWLVTAYSGPRKKVALGREGWTPQRIHPAKEDD